MGVDIKGMDSRLLITTYTAGKSKWQISFHCLIIPLLDKWSPASSIKKKTNLIFENQKLILFSPGNETTRRELTGVPAALLTLQSPQSRNTLCRQGAPCRASRMKMIPSALITSRSWGFVSHNALFSLSIFWKIWLALLHELVAACKSRELLLWKCGS